MANTEKLVYTMTEEDALLLEGVVIEPADSPKQPLAVVWTHGMTGKFYTPTVVAIGHALADRGYAFVAGNNRGHDFGAILYSGQGKPVLAGSGWEAFDESPRDVAAWVSFAVGRGYQGVVLVGHSLGALKVGYYQAQRHDPRVVGLVAASAPRSAGVQSPEMIGLAEKMVAEGRGKGLLPTGASTAGALTISAQTLLSRVQTNTDVYGFATPDPAVSRIECPILACYGTNEAAIGGAAEIEVIRRNATAAARFESRLFEGADHSYYRHEREVAAAIADFAATLTS